MDVGMIGGLVAGCFGAGFIMGWVCGRDRAHRESGGLVARIDREGGQIMGEYILLDGQAVKLGTLESLYYVRFADLVAWIAAGRAARMAGNLEPAEYLEGQPFRFRFPFPDEDRPTDFERLEVYGANYDRGVVVTAPAGSLEDVDHLDLTHWVKAGDSHYGLNVCIPCPAGPAGDKLSHSPLPGVDLVKIVQQRPLEGLLWVVMGCAWCGALIRLDREHAAQLAEHIRASYPGDELRQGIAYRIIAGYVDGAGLVGDVDFTGGADG